MESVINRDRLINEFMFYCRDKGKSVPLLSRSVSRRCDTRTARLSTLTATDDFFRGGKRIGQRTRVTVRLYAIFCAYLEECQFIILPLLCADLVLLLTFWRETTDAAFSYSENWREDLDVRKLMEQWKNILCKEDSLFISLNSYYIIIIIISIIIRGTALAQWLRSCATNRKVAGSIPAGVIGIFHWHKFLPIALWPWGRLSL